MSVYVTAGTVGVAVGPLVGILVFGAFGSHGTGVLIIPGLDHGRLPPVAHARQDRKGHELGAERFDWRARCRSLPSPSLIGVMMSRSWTVNVFQASRPPGTSQLVYGPEFYGPLATTLVLASAVGTVGAERLRTGSAGARSSRNAGAQRAGHPALHGVFQGLGHSRARFSSAFLPLRPRRSLLLMGAAADVERAGLASGLVMGLASSRAPSASLSTGAIADSIGLQRSLRPTLCWS